MDKVLAALDSALTESRRGDDPTTYSRGRARDAALLLTLKGILSRLEEAETLDDDHEQRINTLEGVVNP
jgi:hypothetical protein